LKRFRPVTFLPKQGIMVVECIRFENGAKSVAAAEQTSEYAGINSELNYSQLDLFNLSFPFLYFAFYY
jgi:hypothetical protein